MMDIAVNDRLEPSLKSLETLSSAEDISIELEKLCETFRFRSYIVLVLRDRACELLSDHVVLSNWPAKLLAQYDQERWSRNSPVFERLRRSTIPFTFDIEATPRATRVFDAFTDAGMSRGVYIPVHDRRGVRGAIGLGGTREPVGVEDILPINMACSAIFQAVCNLNLDRAPTGARLSDRELECLRWAAEGKTAAEVAAILGLSEYTVTHYLNRAAQKLDSVNRVQAVVKALRAKLIG
ncbi:DNA-binding transcriptional regulator, CsgD family [Rhizobium sp. RU20A]|uniref:LuxR family transcriptional regulator n=1 Tax=Rhizobium sp. RU20A TaxID=1907412 RepID=UPI00095438D7|nr:LuxR family transcriptional regulator [Rhizobium sp. RU20A]SIR07820.1 DNA-binding transcriptional regulator, CsgD family [Rhizobium sp. RU20A]